MRARPRRATTAAALPLLLLPLATGPAAAQAGPEVVALWLVDAETDQRLVRLERYDTLRLPFLPQDLSVEAQVGEGVDSVRMEIDHVQSALENWPPYSLRGDTQGDFTPAPELRTPGWVTVSAQPYVALAGRQSILVDSSVGPIELEHGQLDVTDGVDVVGHGGRAVVDGQDRSRVMAVDGDHLVNLRSLELANGDAGSSGRGGALSVSNEAYVQMSDSVLRDSRGNFGGGAYVDEANLVLTSSAVRDNIAGTPDNGISGGGVTQRGGGISVREGIVKVRESAVFENLAVRGGGISNFGGTVRVESSSVIDNEALALGGGIENHDNGDETGVLHLSFATVAHNAAGTSGAPPASHRVGGGLHNTDTAFMASSILAENTDAYGAGDPLHAPDCHGPQQYGFKSFRNNVVGALSATCDLGDHSWGTTAWIDHGTPAAPLDPELMSLSTWDHRRYRNLLASSPAIDVGASQTASLYPCPDTDSRGRPRPVGAGCDIGAVERQ